MSEYGVQVRLAHAGDEPAIRACVVAAYEPYLSRMATPPAPMLDDYAELINGGAAHVAVRSGEVVGLIVMWPTDDHLYVDNIAVLPNSSGHGVGTALLDAADRIAVASGHSEVRLYTNEAMTENLAFYPRRGFVETHRAVDDGYDRVYFSRVVASG